MNSDSIWNGLLLGRESWGVSELGEERRLIGVLASCAGDNTSSGGEDGEERKSRRQRRKDYATWASGVSAAAHKPGERDHHGVYQPVMPDGSRGFSRGRGKPVAPPPMQ
jgi:hypothetical protein